MRRNYSLALLALLTAAPAAAQFPDEIGKGARVRLVLADSSARASSQRKDFVVGTVTERAPDTLYLRLHNASGTLAVPRSTVRILDLSLGQAPKKERAITFAAQYGALGVLAGLGLRAMRESSTRGSRSSAAVVGGLIGLGVGVYYGTRPVEQWREVPLSH